MPSPPHVQIQARRDSAEWQWRRLIHYSKPTIAMVNGWCFGGAFTPLVCCDLAIAANEAIFGLSEVNWGIPPGGLVSRALAETVSTRDALWFIMTGETFDGVRAAQMRLVNESVPLAQLRERTTEVAQKLAGMNLAVLRAAKVGFKKARLMSWDEAEDYLYAKLDQAVLGDPRGGQTAGPRSVPRREDVAAGPRLLPPGLIGQGVTEHDLPKPVPGSRHPANQPS